MWMQRKLKGCSRSSSTHFSLSLSVLPETASLSPTAAKTVKHHTASMIFTYCISPDYNIDSRNMSRTHRTEGTKKTESRTAETMAKLERKSAKHLMMCVLSYLPLSRPLSAGQRRY